MPDLLDTIDPDDWNEATDAARRRRRRRRPVRRPAPTGEPGSSETGLLGTRWGRVLVGAVAVLLLLTLIGLAALWPSGDAGRQGARATPTVAATVTGTREVRCPGPTAQRCLRATARIGEGSAEGRRVDLDLGPVGFVTHLSRGDAIRVERVPALPGVTGAAAAQQPDYAFAAVDRRGALRWLVVAFALLVVVLARWRGVLALAGFAISLLLVVEFLVPAIIAGSPPVLVALVGAFAVMFVTVGLTYGVSAQSAAAILGIAVSLLFAGGLGVIAVHAARLDGRSGEIAMYLAQGDRHLSLQGVVLAGLVLGALGVLADMAVTQASAVLALRRTDPTLTAWALFSRAWSVGRDHLIATTHTLVLAYVGATLPLLLVVRSTGLTPVDALNSQDIAEPVVATLVGAMALLVSVPLTTALAAALVSRVPARALPEGGGHHHHH